MTHALVTGGAGFIGSHLAERLVARGDRVTVLDDLSTGKRENLRGLEDAEQFRLVEGSVLDERLVSILVRSADVVYHLAAAVGVDRILRYPLRSLQTNIGGTERVLRACDESHRRLLVASTSEVYGKNESDGLREDDDRVMGAARLSRWFYASANRSTRRSHSPTGRSGSYQSPLCAFSIRWARVRLTATAWWCRA